MADVAIVTDSTADLPNDLVEELGLRVVPMSVAFGTETFMSRITITVEEFYERLRTSRVLPTTSQPAPAWFEEAYQDCADDGLEAAVSIHVSSRLSGTVQLASQLAAAAPLEVEVVDSSQVGGGLALVVLEALRVAEAGAPVHEIVATARRASTDARSYVMVDRLDELRRGGRLSGTQALVGGVLQVKPIIGIEDGRVELIERARTTRRALDRIVERAAAHLDGRPARAVVTHALNADAAAELRDRVEAQLEVTDVLQTVIGPIVGTHTGEGAVGLAIAPITR